MLHNKIIFISGSEQIWFGKSLHIVYVKWICYKYMLGSKSAIIEKLEWLNAIPNLI